MLYTYDEQQCRVCEWCIVNRLNRCGASEWSAVLCCACKHSCQICIRCIIFIYFYAIHNDNNNNALNCSFAAGGQQSHSPMLPQF